MTVFMRPSGIHYLGEFFDCSCNVLDDADALAGILEQAIRLMGFTHVETVCHSFKPVGVTVVCIIGESHVAVHSYPEARHLTIDIFTCSGDPFELFMYLKDQFQVKEYKFRKFFRGKELKEVESNIVLTASNYGLDVQYSVSGWILSKTTAFQKVDIITNPQFGKMVFLDHNIQLSEYDHEVYNEELMAGITDFSKDCSILILGGGDGTLLHKLRSEGFFNVGLVDIDREFVEISAEFLRDFNGGALDDTGGIVFDDACHFLLEQHGQYDVIISDMTVYPESFTTKQREVYFTDLFDRIEKSLNPGGMFRFQCSSVYDESSYELFNDLLKRKFPLLSFNSRYLPSFCKEWVFGSAQKDPARRKP